MSKEKLHNIITESFVNDKIDVDRFLRMSERVDKISENKAKDILTELNLGINDRIREVSREIKRLKSVPINYPGRGLDVKKIKNLENSIKKLKALKIGGKAAIGAALVGAGYYAGKKISQKKENK